MGALVVEGGPHTRGLKSALSEKMEVDMEDFFVPLFGDLLLFYPVRMFIAVKKIILMVREILELIIPGTLFLLICLAGYIYLARHHRSVWHHGGSIVDAVSCDNKAQGILGNLLIEETTASSEERDAANM